MTRSRALRWTPMAAAVLVVLAGCSNAGTDLSDPTTTTTTTATTATTTAATSPTGSPSSTVSSSATTQPEPSNQPDFHTGEAAGVNLTLIAPSQATVRPGGPPLQFDVVLVNTTGAAVARVGLVVSMGHCSCNATGMHMAPTGSLRILDPDTQAWTDAPYVREGGGTDFLSRTLVDPFVLEPGQKVSYTLQLRLDGSQDVELQQGDLPVDATLTNSTTAQPVAGSPTASLPVKVEP